MNKGSERIMDYEVVDELPGVKGRAGRKIDWAGAKEAMIDNPDKWVKIAEDVASSTAGQLRAGRYALFTDSELVNFEFATRRPKDTTYESGFTDLWGKYSA